MDSSLSCFVLLVLIGFVQCSFDNNHHRHHHHHHHHNGTRHDYCVLGAGPSGLQIGFFLNKAKRDYVILERNAGPGSFFEKFPRHRTLISINKIHTGTQNREFNMRHDWNSLLSDKPDLLFKRVSTEFYPPADGMPEYLSMYVNELGLNVRYNVDIGNVKAVETPTGRAYILTDQHTSTYTCSVLLVATGLWVPQQVEFGGSDLVEGYETMSTNPEDYANQAVLILGKGNSAFETAASILPRASRVNMLSNNPVRLAWQTHYVGDLRAVNNEVLDTYQLKSLDGLLEAQVENLAIVQREDESHWTPSGKKTEKKKKLYVTLKKYIQDKNTTEVTGEELPGYYQDNYAMRKPYDRVISCLGFRFNFTIFDSSARPRNSGNAKGRLPELTAWYEGKKTPGLFVLGTAAHSRDYRLSAGGFIHGFRYTARTIHRVLEQRHHNKKWTSTHLETTQLQSWMLKRINEASGTYQMFELLADIILLRGSHCEYVEEFPIQALDQFSTLSGHEVSEHGMIVLVMQYGKKKIDYLGRNRGQLDWTKAWNSSFLHPVFYYYDSLPTKEDMKLRPIGWSLPRPKVMHHMVEDFITEWESAVSHIQPLRRFLEHTTQTDLRAYYAESCFRSSLTHRKPPLFCQHGYLKQRGVAPSSSQWEHIHEVGTAPAGNDAGSLNADPTLPNYLAQAGAAVSSGLKLDF